MATNEQQAQGFPAQSEGNSGRLDMGFTGVANPDDIPLGATQGLDHIRFESTAIRKDFGWVEVGLPATTEILAFGEHGAFTPTGIQGQPGLPQRYIYRISVDPSGPLRIDKYSNGAWSLLLPVLPDDPQSILATKAGFGGLWNVVNSDLLNPPLGDAYFNTDEITLHVAEESQDGYIITPDVPQLIATQAEITIEGVVWTMDAAVNNGTDWTFTLSPGAQRPLTYTLPTFINWDVNSIDPTEQILDIYRGGRFLSTHSIQDVLAVADGTDPIRIWTIKPNFIEDVVPFIGGIPLTSVGEFDDAVVVNTTSVQIPYASSFDVAMPTLTGPTSMDLVVSVEVDEGVGFFEVASAPYTLVVGDSLLNQSITFLDVLKATDVVRLKVKNVEFSDPGVVNGYNAGNVFNNQIEYRAVYTAPITPVPLEDLITFHFQYGFSADPAGGSSPALGDEVEIWGSVREFGVADADLLITTFINQGQGTENPISQTMDFSGFGIDWNNIGVGTPGPMNIVIFARNITNPNTNTNGRIFGNGGTFEWWNGTLAFSVTPIELNYAYESGTVESFQQITPSNFPEITPDFGPQAPVSAPSARYVAGFGDRLFALWNEGDSQILNASSDGNVLMWQLSQTGVPSQTYPDDSVNLVLIDTRVDPLDAIVWMRPVSSQVAILGRHRSLMRVFETGNVALSVGATHWQDGVGSLFSYSVVQTESGLMYLGNNRMVYYMTADQLIPVGLDIQEELIAHLFPGSVPNYESVMGAFDPAFGEYYLGINENGVFDLTHWWVFDLPHFIRTQETKWRKRQAPSNRLVVVNTGLAPFSLATNVAQDDLPPYPYTPSGSEIPQEKTFMFSEGTRIFAVEEDERTLNGEAFEGLWQSPPLSRGAMGEEATLRTIGFTYSAEVDTSFDIEVSGDGGMTYGDPITLNVLATGRQTRRIRQAINTSGYDLRFLIRFNTDKIVKIFNYYPSIVERGRTVL